MFKKVECCVCQEEKKIILNVKCKNAYVCGDCMLGLCEHGKCSKCPYVDRINGKSKIKRTLVIPTKMKINIIRNNNINSENSDKRIKCCKYCCLSLLIIRNIGLYLLFSWFLVYNSFIHSSFDQDVPTY